MAEWNWMKKTRLSYINLVCVKIYSIAIQTRQTKVAATIPAVSVLNLVSPIATALK